MNGSLTIGFEWDRVGSAVDSVRIGHTTTEGGHEFHLGIEYAVLKWRPVVAFRAGMWIEPGRRRIVFVGSEPVNITSMDALQHLALGFGIAFKKFQIDAGTGISDRAVVGSVSIVYSF